MASQQKRKSEKDQNDESFSCTNHEVLDALLGFTAATNLHKKLEAEDSSAEEEEELLL